MVDGWGQTALKENKRLTGGKSSSSEGGRIPQGSLCVRNAEWGHTGRLRRCHQAWPANAFNSLRLYHTVGALGELYYSYSSVYGCCLVVYTNSCKKKKKRKIERHPN